MYGSIFTYCIIVIVISIIIAIIDAVSGNTLRMYHARISDTIGDPCVCVYVRASERCGSKRKPIAFACYIDVWCGDACMFCIERCQNKGTRHTALT